MEEKDISRAVIKRLPRYYRYLGELLEDGVERISSSELSERMKVTASQIRQDLNNFGGFGQQGYGYNVRYLYTEIGKILGLNRTHNMIIVAREIWDRRWPTMRPLSAAVSKPSVFSTSTRFSRESVCGAFPSA